MGIGICCPTITCALRPSVVVMVGLDSRCERLSLSRACIVTPSECASMIPNTKSSRWAVGKNSPGRNWRPPSVPVPLASASPCTA